MRFGKEKFLFMPKSVRLQKFLSECGVASRRKSEELIKAGSVKINGTVAILGDKIDPFKDKVFVRGRQVKPVSQKVYIMLHKPRGFVTTMSDEQGRKCVADLVSDAPLRVYPVGRLDRDSEGLLLMTNDGDFSNLMMHPRSHVPKTYRVTVRPPVTEQMLADMEAGIELDGRKTAPCSAEIIERADNRVVIKFVIYEGRNREIRRMCEAVGLQVARLKRIAVGNLKLGMLPQGKWRELSESEVKRLIADAAKTDYSEHNSEGEKKSDRSNTGKKRTRG